MIINYKGWVSYQNFSSMTRAGLSRYIKFIYTSVHVETYSLQLYCISAWAADLCVSK